MPVGLEIADRLDVPGEKVQEGDILGRGETLEIEIDVPLASSARCYG